MCFSTTTAPSCTVAGLLVLRVGAVLGLKASSSPRSNSPCWSISTAYTSPQGIVTNNQLLLHHRQLSSASLFAG